MRCVLAAAMLLGGCDFFFQLKKVDDYVPPDVAIGIDYDGDEIFAGDNCPALFNPDQLDEDEDGVGNTCDPHPGENDVVVVQELFDGDAPGWLASGSWSKSADGWTSPPVGQGGTFSYQTPRLLHRPALQFGFTLVDYNIDDNHANVEAHLDALDPPGLIGDCALRIDPNTAPISQIVLHVGNDNDGKHVTPDFEKGSIYLTTYARGLDRTWCRAAASSHDRTDDEVETFTTAPVIELKRMQVTLHHVTVYQVVP